MRVRAKQRFEYAQRMIQAGDEVEMPAADAEVLEKIGKVARAETGKVAIAESGDLAGRLTSQKRRYNRRDMKAEK